MIINLPTPATPMIWRSLSAGYLTRPTLSLLRTDYGTPPFGAKSARRWRVFSFSSSPHDDLHFQFPVMLKQIDGEVITNLVK